VAKNICKADAANNMQSFGCSLIKNHLELLMFIKKLAGGRIGGYEKEYPKHPKLGKKLHPRWGAAGNQNTLQLVVAKRKSRSAGLQGWKFSPFVPARHRRVI
jgi:hypothetical protein